MRDDIVHKIDPSLICVSAFKNNLDGGVYKVLRQGTFYVLKFGEYCGRSAPSAIAIEAEALNRAKTIEGITHRVSYCQKGYYEWLLKEYFEGQKLYDFREYGKLDAKLFDGIANTVTQLHSLGIAYLDISEFNIIISDGAKSAKIIDLDSACFADVILPEYFEKYKRRDIANLELIANCYFQ